MSSPDPRTPSPARRTALAIAGMGASLALFLMGIRAVMLDLGLALFHLWNVPLVLGASYFDLLAVCAVTASALAVCWLLRRSASAQVVLRYGYGLLAATMLVAGLVNSQVVGMLGAPLNYQWLYYSDFLTSYDASQAIADQLSFGVVATGILSVLGFFVIAAGITRLARWTIRGPKTATVHAAAAVAAFGVYFWVAGPYMLGRTDYENFANPVYAFGESLVASDAPSLSEMDTPFGGEDFATVAERGADPKTNAEPRIRNVIYFVLESVAARYVDGFGGHLGTTPVLAGLRDRARVFTNAYAHAPATVKSMLSLLCATYPWISYRSVTQDHPDLRVPAITSVLHAGGYRTGVFSASDLGFANGRAFLAGRDIDEMADIRTFEAGALDKVAELVPFRGLDDATAAAEMLEWIARKPDQPFFAMYWSYATHIPYRALHDKWRDFGVGDHQLGIYLNGLRQTDAILGVVLDRLNELGLLDSTLLVIVGDHGEAFGEHGQRGHATGIYEENLRVPLMLVHPSFAPGTVTDAPVGMVDVAPSVLDLLGVPLPGEWQGRSLLGSRRVPRVYFFAPYSATVFGLREGDKKYLFDATANAWEVYDLAADPGELHNLADPESTEIANARGRLAAWLQNHTRYLRSRVGPRKRR